MDELTGGRLPEGRPTLLCGGAGKLPLPLRRLIGDLSARERMLVELEMKPQP